MQRNLQEKVNKIYKALGNEIRKERLTQNKSLRLLAYEYEIQPSLISRIENANNPPMLISIWQIAEALGVKPSELLKRVEVALGNKFHLYDE